MLSGGVLTLLLMTGALRLPAWLGGWGLDYSIYGIAISGVSYAGFSLLFPGKPVPADFMIRTPRKTGRGAAEKDVVEIIGGATLQHGPNSDRIYLMKLGDAEPEPLCAALDELAQENHYGKIFAKVPASCGEPFLDAGYQPEAVVPGFFSGREAAWFLGKYLAAPRREEERAGEYDSILQLAEQQRSGPGKPGENGHDIRMCAPADAPAMSALYRAVFPSYPFPIDEPEFLRRSMRNDTAFFCVEQGGELVALASSEMDPEQLNVEMTDFATLPEGRGQGLAQYLLAHMETEMRQRGMRTAYTIARAISPAMNVTFARQQYAYAGRLPNNTQIGGDIESMNVWYKTLRGRASGAEG